MESKKTTVIIKKLIEAFFVSFAWMNIGGLESTNILLLCVFIAALTVSAYRDRLFDRDNGSEEKIAGVSYKRIKNTSYLLSAIFSVFYAFFTDLTGGLENKVFILIYVICSLAGLFVMFATLLDIVVFKAIVHINEKKNLTRNPFSLKILFFYSAIVFLFCLPFLALNYPGVLTVDSLNQLSQVMGITGYTNHHPWLHTAVIKLFFNIGYGISGNVYTGIAFYTLFQMMIVSLSIGYALECTHEAGLSKGTRLILLSCFILFPYNLMYAITMWKDILFTMAVLVLSITIMRLSFAAANRTESKTSKHFEGMRDSILFFISGLATCVLRHNGYYAFIATVVIWLFVKRKTYKRYIILSVLIIFLAAMSRGPLMRTFNVEPGKYVYNMCMPLQQIGRVVAVGEDMTVDEINWLEKVNTLDYVRAGFDVQCADPMFAWVIDGDEEFFNTHKSEFIKLWLNIGLKHPLTYIKAFTDLTRGYWTPMNPQQTIYFGMSDNDLGLYPKPVIEGPVLIKINELLTKIYGMIPIYGLFYSMGSFFWILLALSALPICKKEYGKIFAFLPVFMLTLTLFIATPLVADMRYSYALFVILPYLAVSVFEFNGGTV